METFLASAFFQALLAALAEAQWSLDVEAEQLVAEGERETLTRVRLRFEHPGRAGFVSVADALDGVQAFWKALYNVQAGRCTRDLETLTEIYGALDKAHRAWSAANDQAPR